MNNSKKYSKNRFLPVFLVVIMILTMFQGFGITAFAADSVVLNTNNITSAVVGTSYQLGNAQANDNLYQVIVSVDSGYFTIASTTIPNGAYVGGLNDSNAYIASASTTAHYSTIIFKNSAAGTPMTSSDIQTFLRDLTFYVDTANPEQQITVDSSNTEFMTDGGSSLTFWNGHLYGEYNQATPMIWTDAYTAASSQTFTHNGTTYPGFLLTVDSDAENALVTNMCGASTPVARWLGGSRMVDPASFPFGSAVASDFDTTNYTPANYASYGAWYWVCGPSAGTKIFNGPTYFSAGAGPVGSWINFAGSEPNNSGTNEGYLECYAGGTWNDLTNASPSVNGYWLEFAPTNSIMNSVSGSIDLEADVTANDFMIPVSHPALTAEDVKNLSNLSAHSGLGYDITNTSTPTSFAGITADPTQLANLNNKLASGTKGDFSVDLVMGPPDTPAGSPITETVTVSIRDASAGSAGTESIAANNFIYGTNQPALTESSALALAQTIARTSQGAIISPLPAGSINPGQLTALNNAIAAGNSGTYPLTISSPDGTSVTVNVELKDAATTTIGGGNTLSANNFEYNIYGASTLTPAQAISNAALSLNDPMGNPLPLTGYVPDPTQLAAINAAISAGNTGTFPLTYSDGTNSVTIQVKLSNTGSTRPGVVISGGGGGTVTPSNPQVPLSPSPTVTATAQTPADFNKTDHFAYIEGYKNGTVKPDGNVTRAEATTMIYRLLTNARRDEILTSTNDFSDVNSSAWFNKAVSSMANGKYVEGYVNGTFRADRAITRAEFVTMLVRFTDAKTNGTVTYSDVPANHWAHDAICAATEYGWINGYSNNLFRPDANITRAEAVSILNRVLYRYTDSKSDLTGISSFSDNSNPASWYYYEIIEASNAHKYESERPDETWTGLGSDYSYDKAKYE